MMTKAICLRQGYQCNCDRCKEWIKWWDNETKAFQEFDRMLREGSNLFHIYEHIRTFYPDQLMQYPDYFEKEYFKARYGDDKEA